MMFELQYQLSFLDKNRWFNLFWQILNAEYRNKEMDSFTSLRNLFRSILHPSMNAYLLVERKHVDQSEMLDET